MGPMPLTMCPRSGLCPFAGREVLVSMGGCALCGSWKGAGSHWVCECSLLTLGPPQAQPHIPPPPNKGFAGLLPSPGRQLSFSSLECLLPALLQACAWAKSFQEGNIINSLSAQSCQGLSTRRLRWKTWPCLLFSS